MSKDKQLKTQQGGAITVAPDYLAGGAQETTELMAQFVRPPRLKLVQRTSDEYFDKGFKEGEVVMVPQLLRVVGPNEPFHFVPVFFFPEWCEQNSFSLRGTAPMIRERTFDRNHPIAIASRSPKTREVKHPEFTDGDHKLLYVEYLNFVTVILGDNQASGIDVIMSFSKGEWATGSNFGTSIAMRKAVCYGCVFEAKIGEPRQNAKKQRWYGLDLTNPSAESGVSPWVPQDKIEIFRALHERYKSLHAANQILVDHDDDDVEKSPKSSRDLGGEY